MLLGVATALQTSWSPRLQVEFLNGSIFFEVAVCVCCWSPKLCVLLVPTAAGVCIVAGIFKGLFLYASRRCLCMLLVSSSTCADDEVLPVN